MLHRFLEKIWAGEVQSLMGLAQSLNISQDMVLQMAKELTRLGYLQEIGSDCDSPQQGCVDCPVTSSCQAPVRHWFLTEKGRAAVATK